MTLLQQAPQNHGKEIFQIPKNLWTFPHDDRMPVEDLYRAFGELAAAKGWEGDAIGGQRIRTTHGKLTEAALPIPMMRTKIRGRALWLLAGIHGEEPAGPNAIAQNLGLLTRMNRRGVPMVVLPLCNPNGYRRDWRYQDMRRKINKGTSVADPDHVLIDPKNLSKTRRRSPSSPEAAALTAAILKLTKSHPPRLAIDLHEDEDLKGDRPYLYAHSSAGHRDPVALRIAEILAEQGIRLEQEGHTRFQEPIRKGIVRGEDDGSVEELFVTPRIILDGKTVRKPAAKTAIVVETSTVGVPLAMRVRAHRAVIVALPELWELAA